jgi:hypothetical protein
MKFKKVGKFLAWYKIQFKHFKSPMSQMGPLLPFHYGRWLNFKNEKHKYMKLDRSSRNSLKSAKDTDWYDQWEGAEPNLDVE